MAGTGRFDAVLMVSFGGPQGPADIRPFLQNVLRGRNVPAARIEEVAHHYELFEGVSPLTELTLRQAARLEERLAAGGAPLPVYVGMRNWHPFLVDTLRMMVRDGVRQAVGLVTAAHRSYSSCLQYKQNVLQAREELRAAGDGDLALAWTGDWHLSDGFIDANVDNVIEALSSLPPDLEPEASVIFTAHSIPRAMAARYPYERQLRESAALVIDELGRRDSVRWSTSGSPRSDPGSTARPWALVYQSRSGRPDDPWLEPDVVDYLEEERERGTKAAVLCPIGFVCDHIEVLYDLDVEACARAREIGLHVARASAANCHPRFIDALAGAVRATIDRHATGRVVPIVSTARPNATELPPPHRNRLD